MQPPAINPLECTAFVYALPNQFKSIGFPYREFLNPSDLSGCNNKSFLTEMHAYK